MENIADVIKGSFDELKKTNEELIASEVKGLGVADLKEKMATIDAKLDAEEDRFEQAKAEKEALEAKTAKFEETLEELKVAFQRDGGVDESEVKDIKAEAQEVYFRKNVQGMGEDQIKALSTDSDPDGGFRLAATTTANIMTYMYETSPMRQYASVISISGPDYIATIDNDEASAGWVGEKQARTETTTPIFQTKRIVPYELYAEPQATQRMLDDADFPVESWLAGKVSDQFSRKENTAFIIGDGVEKPRGILTYDAGVITNTSSQELIEQISSGDANRITADALLDMEAAVKTEYLNGSNFFLNRTSVGAIRKLKDGQNNYLWSPGFDSKTGPSIMGYNYARFEDMPAEQANALPVMFGNMKLAYQIVDRMGIRTLRDPYTGRGSVKFYTTKRVGGDVVNFEAIKLMKVEA